jgi:hypothetical protein
MMDYADQRVDSIIAHWNADRDSMQALIAEARAQRDEAVEASDGWQARYVQLAALFAPGPDTACRTTWHDGVEYVEVPMADVQSALAPPKDGR